MEFTFSAEQEALRGEIRSFLDEHLPPEREEAHIAPEWSNDPDDYARALDFNKRLAEQGWLTAHWPREFGGMGLSILEQVVLREEMAYRRAPILNANGLNMLGPVLMLNGSDEQKAAHLPGIAASDVMWCQGYSEPNSGSDLASLQTRAIRDGDDYIINGSKIWTGHARRADWMFLLARTDSDAPKHRGISFFLLDMKTPGITVQPLQSMTGHVHFCQEFFEDVRVPATNLVGEENRGWYIGATLLDFERSNIASAAGFRRSLDELVSFLRGPEARPIDSMARQRLRHELADRYIELAVGRNLSYRIASIQEVGGVPNYEASMGKLYFSELGNRLATTTLHALGLAGQMAPGSSRAVLAGSGMLGVMTTLIGTIGGGTSEIQRNIIATRGLGLPRA